MLGLHREASLDRQAESRGRCQLCLNQASEARSPLTHKSKIKGHHPGRQNLEFCKPRTSKSPLGCTLKARRMPQTFKYPMLQLEKMTVVLWIYTIKFSVTAPVPLSSSRKGSTTKSHSLLAVQQNIGRMELKPSHGWQESCKEGERMQLTTSSCCYRPLVIASSQRGN